MTHWFLSHANSGLSVKFWQCIMKQLSLSFQYLIHGTLDLANAAQWTVTPLSRHWQETNISSMSRPNFLILIFVKKFSKNIRNPLFFPQNSGHDIMEILLLSKCLVNSIKIGRAVFVESCAPWPHIEFGDVHSMKLAFYCSELQSLEINGHDSQSRFQAIYSFTVEILTGSTIIRNYCHYLRCRWFTPPPWNP